MTKLNKLKICRIMVEFPPTIGGSITHTLELARHMAPYCERQFFIVPEINEDTTKIDDNLPFEVSRVKYLQFRFLKSLKSKFVHWLPIMPLIDLSFDIAAIRKCLWLNKKYGIDIIHAHGIAVSPAAMIAARLINKPVVLMLDGTLHSYSRLSGIYEDVIYRLIRCDHYFVVDNGGPALKIFQKLKRNRSLITPVFINVDTSRTYPRSKNFTLWNQLGLTDKSKFVFISIHNLEPIQGVGYSIYGFKKLIDEHNIQDAVLLVVGGGSEGEKLKDLVKELGIEDKVVFAGPIDNSSVPEYYSLSDVALSTSIKINVNTSTIEAMACKVPVIAFDCGNSADLLIRHLENGILVNPGSLEDLAKAMFMLYQKRELRDMLGANAREFIVANRNWDKRIECELEVYRRLIKREK